MMDFKYVSASGVSFDLMNNDYVFLVGVDGQTVANASLSSTVISGIDGDTITSETVQPRTITLDLRIKQGVNVEEAKRSVLKVVKIKKQGTLLWTQNDRSVEIEGIVESIDMPRWNNSVNIQISMHCEQPFWEDVEAVVEEIDEAIPLHYFTESQDDMLFFPDDGIVLGEYDFSRTREIENAGDVAVGLEIEIIAYDTVTNPIIYGEGGEFFGVGYGTGTKQVTMQSGDIITITTGKGNKTVKKNGVSLFDKIKPQSTWLQLDAGESTFSINSDDESIENMTFYLTFKQRYV